MNNDFKLNCILKFIEMNDKFSSADEIYLTYLVKSFYKYITGNAKDIKSAFIVYDTLFNFINIYDEVGEFDMKKIIYIIDADCIEHNIEIF
jgi:hypothetical protein|nr:MAG TPA: hypothetical protein [Caudoviricetes sp.]